MPRPKKSSTLEKEEMTQAFEQGKFPRDMKIEARRELVLFLWLRGKTYAQIEKITGFERWTIWNDLKFMQGELAKNPATAESIRQSALFSMRIMKADILTKAEAADLNVAWRYYLAATHVEELILERYTQPGREVAMPSTDESDIKQALIDYLVEKLGPEGMKGFEEWFRARVDAIKSQRLRRSSQGSNA